jgi:hypothetical protein
MNDARILQRLDGLQNLLEDEKSIFDHYLSSANENKPIFDLLALFDNK